MRAAYSIRDLAQEFALTPRTIRHYEEQGLVRPTREGAARIFSNRDRGRLKLALRCKRLGFPLNEIRELFELYDLKDEKRQLTTFLARLEKRRLLLEQQREDIAVMLNEISFFAVQCERLLREQEKVEK
jgi:DNA-binding transcriptional MerR regulator